MDDRNAVLCYINDKLGFPCFVYKMIEASQTEESNLSAVWLILTFESQLCQNVEVIQ